MAASLIGQVCVTLCTLIAVIGSAHLPKQIKNCKSNDPKLNDCLRVNVQNALAVLKDGDSSIPVLSIDPLKIETIGLPEGPLNLRYKNLNILGMSASLIDSYQADLSKYHLHTEATTPLMQLVGEYTMEGRILVLPVNGHGQANITLSDLKSVHDLHFEPYEKKGKTYWRCTEYKIRCEAKHVYFNFENLFNGDPTLGPQVNNFLNENWVEVSKEFIPLYEEVFGIVFRETTNQIFSRVPIDEIFLP